MRGEGWEGGGHTCSRSCASDSAGAPWKRKSSIISSISPSADDCILATTCQEGVNHCEEGVNHCEEGVWVWRLHRGDDLLDGPVGQVDAQPQVDDHQRPRDARALQLEPRQRREEDLALVRVPRVHGGQTQTQRNC